MRCYLLDTNIVSEITKPRPNARVIERIMEFTSISAISAVTWAELWHGVCQMPEGRRRKGYEEFLNERILADYEIIPFDEYAGKLCGQLGAAAEKIGKTRCYDDLQIAATAIAQNMILVTRNTRDFEHIPNLMMENWFE